ncbi:MAG: ATP-binding cassette, subfamily multidrug efflux pump, partial [Actinomycetota bacterium]|nr:ATP-binding cassette, subfamily multidrug efflux pump [Actinomycetota bacterium]
MSDTQKPAAPARPMGPPGGMRRGPGGGGGPFGGMGMPVEKSLNFGPSAKRLLGRLAPERIAVTGVIVLGIISVALNVVGPKILGNATTLIYAGVLSGNGVDFNQLKVILGSVLVLYVFASIFSFLQSYVLNGVTQRTVFRLRGEVEAKINRLPLTYFDRVPRGELLSRVTNDIDNISQSMQQTMSQALTSVLSVLGVLILMSIISPLLAVIVLVTVPLTLLIASLIAKRSQKLFVQQWKNTGELNGQIEETFTGHALVKVFGRQREVEQRFEEKNEQLFQASFGAQFVSGIIMPSTMFVGNLVYVAIAVVGGLQVASGSLALGDVQAFIQYSRQFTQQVSQLGSMANLLQSGVASAERVFELLDAEEQTPDASPSEVPTSSTGRLAFENVSFRYDPATPLIDDLSLVAKPGQTIAIVGPTGAGKTTLVNLMMRFYELNAGRITLDGVDISGMTREDLRSRMGMVLQDTWLFGGTIRDNIAYGRTGATDGEIQDAARATYVDRFVHSLPDGYDTVLDDEASNVSAGEKQLLTIARA